MPTINDLPSLKAHSRALDAELKAVFEKYGLEFHGRSAKIGMGQVDYKITLKYGSAEEQEDVARMTFEAYAPMEGIDGSVFGKKYKLSDGHVYRVIGFNPKKPKNCIMLEQVHTGRKNFHCSSRSLKTSIALKQEVV